MRMNREKFLTRARNGEEKVLLARTLDLAEAVLRRGFTQVTDFYDPYHTGLIISTVRGVPDLAATADGGFPGAERTRVAIHRVEVRPDAEDFNIGAVTITGCFKGAGANHRDFLGSLLGLGLKRDKLGDLLVAGEGARLAAAKEVVPYIRANLVKVGRVNVTVEEIAREELQPPEQAYKEIRATVPSLRLDAVAAAGFGVSRSRIAREIEAERLSVNWRVCPDLAAPVREGDVISARGRGRVALAEVRGPLKSGRFGVLLKRYL